MEGQKIQSHDPIWDDISRRVAQANGLTEKSKAEPFRPMSYPEMYKKGVSMQVYKAIKEAHDGEEAIKRKSARLGRILGVSYLMLTEVMQLIDEAELMMDKQFRMKSGFAHAVKGINKSFDEFYRNIVGHISPEEMKKFSADLEKFDENVRSWADLAGYKEATEEDERKSIHARAINLHLDFLDKCDELRTRFGQDALKSLMAEIKAMGDKPEKHEKKVAAKFAYYNAVDYICA